MDLDVFTICVLLRSPSFSRSDTRGGGRSLMQANEVSIRKVRDAASGIVKEYIPAPVFRAHANREPHVQVRLLVLCSKNGFAFRG